MNRTVVSSIALLSLLVACKSDNPVAPISLSGKYALEQANNSPLPFLFSTSPSFRYTLLGDTLNFDGRGGVVRSRVFLEKNLTDDSIRLIPASIPMQYRISDGTIEIGSFSGCPADAICVANDKGTLQPGSLSLVSGFYSGTLLDYRRLGTD
jgi:hypothetical protein